MQAQRGRRAPAQQVWASSGHSASALPNAQEWLAQHGEVRLLLAPEALITARCPPGRSRTRYLRHASRSTARLPAT